MSKEYLASFVSHDAGGVLYVNTLAVKADPTGPDLIEPSMGDVLDEIDTWLMTQYRKCLHTQYTVDRIELRGIVGTSGDALKPIGLAGTYNPASTQAIPKELCLVITLKTDHPGKSGHGRIFMPSPRSADGLGDATSWRVVTDESTYWKECQDFANLILAGHDAHGGDTDAYHLSGRLWSRKNNTTYDLTGAVPRTPYHWLRSRSTAP